MWWKVGYTSKEIKRVALFPDRDNHPVRLLVEGDHPVLLLGYPLLSTAGTRQGRGVVP
jgi:hypothetical protein